MFSTFRLVVLHVVLVAIVVNGQVSPSPSTIYVNGFESIQLNGLTAGANNYAFFATGACSTSYPGVCKQQLANVLNPSITACQITQTGTYSLCVSTTTDQASAYTAQTAQLTVATALITSLSPATVAKASTNDIQLTGLAAGASNYAYFAPALGFASCAQAYASSLCKGLLANQLSPKVTGCSISAAGLYRTCVSTSGDASGTGSEYHDQGFPLTVVGASLVVPATVVTSGQNDIFLSGVTVAGSSFWAFLTTSSSCATAYGTPSAMKCKTNLATGDAVLLACVLTAGTYRTCLSASGDTLANNYGDQSLTVTASTAVFNSIVPATVITNGTNDHRLTNLPASTTTFAFFAPNTGFTSCAAVYYTTQEYCKQQLSNILSASVLSCRVDTAGTYRLCMSRTGDSRYEYVDQGKTITVGASSITLVTPNTVFVNGINNIQLTGLTQSATNYAFLAPLASTCAIAYPGDCLQLLANAANPNLVACALPTVGTYHVCVSTSSDTNVNYVDYVWQVNAGPALITGLSPVSAHFGVATDITLLGLTVPDNNTWAYLAPALSFHSCATSYSSAVCKSHVPVPSAGATPLVPACAVSVAGAYRMCLSTHGDAGQGTEFQDQGYSYTVVLVTSIRPATIVPNFDMDIELLGITAADGAFWAFFTPLSSFTSCAQATQKSCLTQLVDGLNPLVPTCQVANVGVYATCLSVTGNVANGYARQTNGDLHVVPPYITGITPSALVVNVAVSITLNGLAASATNYAFFAPSSRLCETAWGTADALCKQQLSNVADAQITACTVANADTYYVCVSNSTDTALAYVAQPVQLIVEDVSTIAPSNPLILNGLNDLQLSPITASGSKYYAFFTVVTGFTNCATAYTSTKVCFQALTNGQNPIMTSCTLTSTTGYRLCVSASGDVAANYGVMSASVLVGTTSITTVQPSPVVTNGINDIQLLGLPRSNSYAAFFAPTTVTCQHAYNNAQAYCKQALANRKDPAVLNCQLTAAGTYKACVSRSNDVVNQYVDQTVTVSVGASTLTAVTPNTVFLNGINNIQLTGLTASATNYAFFAPPGLTCAQAWTNGAECNTLLANVNDPIVGACQLSKLGAYKTCVSKTSDTEFAYVDQVMPVYVAPALITAVTPSVVAIRSINNIELTGLPALTTNFAFLALETGFTSCIDAYNTGIYRTHLANVASPSLAGVQLNVTGSVYRVCVSNTTDAASEYKDQGYTLSAVSVTSITPLQVIAYRSIDIQLVGITPADNTSAFAFFTIASDVIDCATSYANTSLLAKACFTRLHAGRDPFMPACVMPALGLYHLCVSMSGDVALRYGLQDPTLEADAAQITGLAPTTVASGGTLDIQLFGVTAGTTNWAFFTPAQGFQSCANAHNQAATTCLQNLANSASPTMTSCTFASVGTYHTCVSKSGDVAASYSDQLQPLVAVGITSLTPSTVVTNGKNDIQLTGFTAANGLFVAYFTPLGTSCSASYATGLCKQNLTNGADPFMVSCVVASGGNYRVCLSANGDVSARFGMQTPQLSVGASSITSLSPNAVVPNGFNDIQLNGLSGSSTNYAFVALDTGFASCRVAYTQGMCKQQLTNPTIKGCVLSTTGTYRLCLSKNGDSSKNYVDQAMPLTVGAAWITGISPNAVRPSVSTDYLLNGLVQTTDTYYVFLGLSQDNTVSCATAYASAACKIQIVNQLQPVITGCILNVADMYRVCMSRTGDVANQYVDQAVSVRVVGPPVFTPAMSGAYAYSTSITITAGGAAWMCLTKTLPSATPITPTCACADAGMIKINAATTTFTLQQDVRVSAIGCAASVESAVGTRTYMIDACLGSPCKYGGTCHDGSPDQQYTCDCVPPFYGPSCENYNSDLVSSSSGAYQPGYRAVTLQFTLTGVITNIRTFNPAFVNYLLNTVVTTATFPMLLTDNFAVRQVTFQGLARYLPRLMLRVRLLAAYSKSVITLDVNNNHGAPEVDVANAIKAYFGKLSSGAAITIPGQPAFSVPPEGVVTQNCADGSFRVDCTNDSGSSSNAGAVAGGVIGGIVGAAILVFLVWYGWKWWKARSSKGKLAPQDTASPPPTGSTNASTYEMAAVSPKPTGSPAPAPASAPAAAPTDSNVVHVEVAPQTTDATHP